MNCYQFNEKYQEFLEEGHYGLDIENEKVISFLDLNIFPILTRNKDFSYSQIKTKFGGVRFYTNLPIPLESFIEKQLEVVMKK